MGTCPNYDKNPSKLDLNNPPKIDILRVNILCGVCKNTAVQVRDVITNLKIRVRLFG